MYRSQGHNIRCFQNVEPYKAPRQEESQDNGEFEDIQDILKDKYDDNGNKE
jgi:hypothetical protein